VNARIRFFDPCNDEETGQYSQRLARIDGFWKEFQRINPQPSGAGLKHVRTALSQVHDGLGAELSVHHDHTASLHVLPLGGVYLRSLADLLVQRAPKRMPWLFEAARPALPLARCLAIVAQDFGLDLSSARCRVGLGRGHLISVVIASHLFGASENEAAERAANEFTARLMGDHDFEDWVSEVSVVGAPRPGPLRLVGADEQQLPLRVTELQAALVAARASVTAALPDYALHTFCERADWVLFEFDGAVDAPVQPDLLTAATMCPEMLKCFLSDEPFASQRFSKHGERFCYLKLTLPGSFEERTERRAHIEETLNLALVPGQLGCVIGVGVGREYVYLDLALVNLDAALKLIRKKLAQLKVSRESWLLFCDDEWRTEWIGIYDDTPVPKEVSARRTSTGASTA
jgi:hypothetical protein